MPGPSTGGSTVQTGYPAHRRVVVKASHKRWHGSQRTPAARTRYHFGPEGLTLAAKTIEQFIARAIRLYEHEPGEVSASSRLGLYVRRRRRLRPRGGQRAGTEMQTERRNTCESAGKHDAR